METSTARAVHDPAAEFYIDALRKLQATDIPFLVGGAFAFSQYARRPRDTKDIDIFVRPDDCPRVLEAFRRLGYETELPFPHWLGKIRSGGHFMDVIFNSGNGVARVDDLWFEHAPKTNVLGVIVRLSPVEEMIWSKAFLQERERFDGADVLHLLRETGSGARLAAAPDALRRLLARAPQPPDPVRLRVSRTSARTFPAG